MHQLRLMLVTTCCLSLLIPHAHQTISLITDCCLPLLTWLHCMRWHAAHLVTAGAMLEVHKRAAMPSVLYCLLAAYALEGSALVYATAVNFGVLDKHTAEPCYTQEELAR